MPVYWILGAVIAAVPSVIAVCIGRFVTGFASAIPTTVAFGSFEGLYDREALIWVVYIFKFHTYLPYFLELALSPPAFSTKAVVLTSWSWKSTRYRREWARNLSVLLGSIINRCGHSQTNVFFVP